MTALDRYVRLEAVGLWRQGPDAPAREVIVTFGHATATLTDLEERPLGHWALAGMAPLAETDGATVYSMTADGAETLAIRDRDMVAAIAAVAPRPRQPPRRRRRLPLGPALAVIALCALAFAAPRLIRAEVARMVPPEKAEELGDRMLIALIETRGPPCATAAGALAGLATRLAPDDPPRLRVLDLGDRAAIALPGGTLALDRQRLTQAPDEAAGWAALELERDPVATLVRNAGLLADLRYLLHGDFGEGVLARAAAAPPPAPTAAESAAALSRMARGGIDPPTFAIILKAAGHAAPAARAPLPPDGLRLPPLDDAERAALRRICR
jgi:hypothetical protein